MRELGHGAQGRGSNKMGQDALTDCFINQLAFTSKRLLSKKSLYDCKQKPNSISTKTSYLEIFPHFSALSLTLGINLYFWISPRFFVKIWKMAPREYSGVRGKPIHEKNLKSKISCQTPFKGRQDWDFFWLRFWNLYYFFISFVKILRFYKKNFLIRPLLGEIWFFRLVWDSAESV